MGGAAPSSVMVFQPPQDSHLPDHLGAVVPQVWQTKEAEDLAIANGYKKGTQSARAIMPDLTDYIESAYFRGWASHEGFALSGMVVRHV